MIRLSKPQRQEGVNMVRIKLPFGRITIGQLCALADVSVQFTNGNLHTTTRQDIQLHYIKQKDIETLWEHLYTKGLTDKETFGNTLRNITASAMAGIDPKEAFDVTPYVSTVKQYFDGHESTSDLGRKVKIAFSSNLQDSAYTFMNDIGFTPIIQNGERGFKVVLGGGMAGQTMIADVANKFLPHRYLVPYLEAILRLFSQFGEKLDRNKSRLKFLVQTMGFDYFVQLVNEEFDLIKKEIEVNDDNQEYIDQTKIDLQKPLDIIAYNAWKEVNVIQQKQNGYSVVALKLRLGNISEKQVKDLAPIVKKYGSTELKVTSNQGIQINFVRNENLPAIFNELSSIGLADLGFDSTLDVTACPGTDTCNLGITNSTSLALELENMMAIKYPELIFQNNLKIKISGCVNSCGHHTVASIGFQGTTLRYEGRIIPASKILIGGGVDQNGQGHIAEKLVTIPTKRSVEALDILLRDFQENRLGDEFYGDYYRSKDKEYFIGLLADVANLHHVVETEFIDWGDDHDYEKHVPRKPQSPDEDLITQLLSESESKLSKASNLIDSRDYSDASIHIYNAMVWMAKALLLKKNVECGTQVAVLKEFDQYYIFVFSDGVPLKEYALSYKKSKIDKPFVTQYFENAQRLLEYAKDQLFVESEMVN